MTAMNCQNCKRFANCKPVFFEGQNPKDKIKVYMCGICLETLKYKKFEDSNPKQKRIRKLWRKELMEDSKDAYRFFKRSQRKTQM